MTSRRQWALRLWGIVGTASSAAALQGGCGSSSCPDTDSTPWQTECFSKAELAENAAGAGGGEPADVCPTTEEIQQTKLAGASVDSVTDDGDRCCYRYYYPCEGRLLLHDEEIVLAPSALRRDWCEETSGADSLDAATRCALAAAWARDAAFEHASIASFSRFILELLSLGAPHELVSSAQRALADEVRHARLCYTLASRYADEALGPGPLAVPAFSRRSLRQAALDTAREGCIAETVAAFVAGERLARARDPLVVRTLRGIVADEQRHAELAWRFVRWAVDRDPSIAAPLASLFEQAAREVHSSLQHQPPCLAPDLLAAHGQLSEHERASLTRQAMAQLIEPCAKKLTGSEHQRGPLSGRHDQVTVSGV
jgi:hypothetical protein